MADGCGLSPPPRSLPSPSGDVDGKLRPPPASGGGYRVVVGALLFVAAVALALAGTVAAGDAGEVKVVSDSAVYGGGGEQVVFSGNVLATAGVWRLAAASLRADVGGVEKEYRAFGSPLTVFGETGEGEDVVLNAMRLRFSGGDALAEGEVRLCAGVDCARAEVFAASARWRGDSESVELRGTPARGSWLPPEGGEKVRARARVLRFDAVSGWAVLQGDALFARGDAQITGEKIEFNLRTGEMKALAPAEGRVRAILGAGE